MDSGSAVTPTRWSGDDPSVHLNDLDWSNGSVASALVLIAGLALGLRLAGIWYGLPAVYNPDEVAIMSRALAFAKGDLNPHNFLYPTLYFYALVGWVGAYFVAARLLGFVASIQAFQSQFFVDPTNVYVAGRLLTVACGLTTVVLVYRLGARLFGRQTGVLSALLLAVAPFHVRDSHYVKHDVPATLAVVACCLVLARFWREPAPHEPGTRRRGRLDWGDVAPAVLFGLACSIHYYAIFLALPVALAVAIRHSDKGWAATLRHLALAALISAAAFFMTSPFILIDSGTAVRDILANRRIVVDRAVSDGASWFASLGSYARLLWLDATGWPVALLALIGVVQLARQSWRLAALLLSFPIVFFVFIANTVPASRYLNPILPFAALLAACAIAWLSRVVPVRWRRAAVVVIAVGAAVPGLWASVRSDHFFRQDDTRTVAGRFIETRIPAGATILVQPYSVPLRQSRASLVESLEQNLGSLGRASVKFTLQLALDPYPAPAYRLLFLGDGGLDAEKIYVSYGAFRDAQSLAPLRAMGVQYVVLKRYNRPDPATRPFLEALGREATRIAAFSPYRPDAPPEVTTAVEPFLHNTDARIVPALERPGPLVEIWKVDASHPLVP